MPEVTYTTRMTTPRSMVWPFVADINNWAPLVKGYQSHQIINDRESIWTVRVEVGPLSRITKAQIQITEWVEGEKVAFTLKGINEPVTGAGAITIHDDGPGTEISGTGNIEFGGTMGRMVNRLLAPFVESVTDDLVTKVVAAVQGPSPLAERPTPSAFRKLLSRIIGWLKRFLGRGTPPESCEPPGAHTSRGSQHSGD